jgi:diaminohydroxyphosphoribosylaminopyrimidine deaminase / 5-amino-6-(5-phosphoribosylamino)uracil reductase
MTIDQHHLRRALDLARAAIGLASPNPLVGAVIVDLSGREIGAGAHTYNGVKHAEVLAIEKAADKARGATLYINLEPCSHQGRTGPCADAVISAGIARVVCSMEDPNPQVAGKGFARLREAGIQVDVGLFEAEAKKLNESFAKYIRTGKPLVTLKSAMSLDGKIAPAEDSNGESQANRPWITGEASRQHVQQLRHQHDAILVGIGTVLADDPLLTDRTALPRRRKLLRVLLDSSLRTPLTSSIVDSADDDVLILCSAAASTNVGRKRPLEAKGVHVEEISADNLGGLDFAAVVRLLGTMQIASLIIEGGSRVNAAALASGEVDKIFLYYAPKLFGDGAVPFLANGAQIGDLNVDHCEWHSFGDDSAVEGYLRDPYAG